MGIIEIICKNCGAKGKIGMKTEFIHENLHLSGAITNTTVHCTNCNSINMIAIPHEIVASYSKKE